MKKLSRAVQLLWKAHKKELELKETIKSKDRVIKNMGISIDNMNNRMERLCTNIKYDENIIDDLKAKIIRNGHILRYRIQKYIPPYDMFYDSVGTKINKEYFEHLVEDSKLKMMNELIEKGFAKMIDYDDCVEIAIHLAEDDKWDL